MDGVAPEDWLSGLPTYQINLVNELLSSGLSETEAAELWLSRVGPDNNFAFGAGNPGTNYLSAVQTEFRKLICGDDSYEAVRAEASKVWGGAKYGIVSMMALAIAAHVGIAAAVIAPVIALLMSAVGRIGINAWCALPPPPPPTITAE